ncbi:MAG: penicillin acylase family protein [Verrucomicrobiota bacterium]
MVGRRRHRFWFWILGLAIGLPSAGLAVLTGILLSSRALLDGTVSGIGVQERVEIDRDAMGIPTLRAGSRIDLAFATGFLHAQDRFFQMDLLRRNAAGELAELLGAALADYDGEMRRHRLRQTAQIALATAPDRQRAVVDAYTEGVNAGLRSLRARPPEYLLLNQVPRAWDPVDSLLVSLLMSERLQDAEGSNDQRRGLLAEVLPGEALDFFDPSASEWEAALDGSTTEIAPIPSPGTIGFRTGPATTAGAFDWERPLMPGSNSWGVDGSVSSDGGAIVANDMHLDLGVPNIWYRVSARWTDDGQSRQFDGVTLPGAPVFIIGSNGRIAWGFTHAALDVTDVILVETDPSNPRRYRTPDGWRDLESVTEEIRIAGAPARKIHHDRTLWGPVLGTNHLGQTLALRWVAHQPEALNLQLLELETAGSVEDAVRIAPTCGIADLNLLVGDREGHLAWTLVGRLPRRIGFDGQVPVSWADGSRRWDGWREPAAYPVVRGPRLWTANNRMSGDSNYLSAGVQQTDLGARATQIREDLQRLSKVDETGVFALYRDDRALFLERWQRLLLETLDRGPLGTNEAAWTQLRGAVENWGGRASTNSVGYRVVRAFRFKVGELFFQPLVARCQESGSDLPIDSVRWETPLWTCLTRKPLHLLAPRFTSYEALLATAVESVLADLRAQGLTLPEATWGQRNTVRIQHPISRALPRISGWLDMTPRALSGDDHMPKIQGVRFGPSERMVVAPGHEERGMLQMPGGQSGHFLSPFYRKGHTEWEDLTPTPLMPGPTEHRLVLSR